MLTTEEYIKEVMKAEQYNPVSKPKHYAGDIEPIDAIEAWDLNFRLANVVKYVARHTKKGTPLQDLKKAMWYLKREIDRWEDEDTP